MEIQVKSLLVKNCGPLRDVEVSFMDGDKPRPTTVIGGANGSGKTTILELIATLLDSLLEPLEFPRIVDGGGTKTDLCLLIDNVEYFIGYDFSSNSELRDTIPPSFVQDIANMGKQNIPISRMKEPSSILYFPYYRRMRSNPGEQIHREDITYRWLYRYEAVDTFAGSLNSYFVWLDYAEPELFEQMKKFVNDIVLPAGKRISGVMRKKLQTMIELPDGTQHPLEQLSSGEQNLLIILLELRRRLTPGSIVLIDEIENSLHPAFQHRLGTALKKLQREIPFQLIVTTHAPAFLDIFGRENTLILTVF